MEELAISKDESRIDFTFLSHSQEALDLLDHMRPDCEELERFEEQIREFEEKNAQLKQYLQQLRTDPESVRQNPSGEHLRQKIELIQKQNLKLRQYVASAKISAKTVELERVSSGIATPRNRRKEFFVDEGTHRDSLKSNPRNRRILEQIDNNYEKVFTDNASTCLNYRVREEEPRLQEPELNRIEQLTQTDKKVKNGLRMTAEIECRKREVVQRELVEQEAPPQANSSIKKMKNLKALEEYKNQLLQELKNSQLKQSQLQKIVQELKKVHRSSLEKFHEVARLLQELKSSKLAEEGDLSNEIDLIERYQEALQLEQVLAELQQKNDQRQKERDAENEQEITHLTSLRRELYRIIQKLGLKVDTNGLSLEESLEVLCSEIINNVYLPNARSVSSTNAKLLKIRELTEQQKNHNSKVIAELKSKEQALSHQLMSLQIGQNK